MPKAGPPPRKKIGRRKSPWALHSLQLRETQSFRNLIRMTLEPNPLTKFSRSVIDWQVSTNDSILKRRPSSVSMAAWYEDYLDSQITLTDMFYLEDLELARQLIELGYRSNAEVMTRTDFADFKAAAEQARLQALRRTPKKLFSAGKDLDGLPFLKALAEREVSMATSKLVLATIIFIRDFNPQGHEISGYIDFGERLKNEDLEPVFDRKKKLLPSPHDLSYYNWDTKISIQNSSQNWQVIADSDVGVLFKNKKDRKTLNVDPSAPPGDLSTRTVINTKDYKHVVIFDHITRRQY